jgi:hypothetical protein
VKSSKRWLIIFGAAIGFLVIVAIVLVFTMSRQEGASLLSEDTPEGVVQRYILALQEKEYVTAYSYLSPPADEELTYEKWRESFGGYGEQNEARVTLGESAVTGNEATVEVTVDVFRAGGPFDNPVSTQRITFFLKQEGASWKIKSPTYVWWFFY